MDGDGSEIPQNMWQSGEPSNVWPGRVENCAMFRPADLNLTDTACESAHYPLCQFRTKQNGNTE